jgi:TolA-binding protein
MKNLTHIFAVFGCCLLAGCAAKTTAPVGSTPTLTKTPGALALERKQREMEEAKQDQKDRNRILYKKSQLEGNERSKTAAQVHPQNQRIELINPSQSIAKNDKELYAELVGSYDRNDEIAFFSRFQTFSAKYAKSPLADDAIYLAGLMSLSNKNYGPALRYFNQVLQKYPLSNKSASALFAKGVTLKKMNLNDESRKVFAKVGKVYPGSPEALRARNEMKIMNR